MRAIAGNLMTGIPGALPDELVTVLTEAEGFRIERIVSLGHVSPPAFWYDQGEDEFVVIVAGAARLELEGRGEVALGVGDWIDIPRHLRHRVTWTVPDEHTIWLAVFHGQTKFERGTQDDDGERIGRGLQGPEGSSPDHGS